MRKIFKAASWSLTCSCPGQALAVQQLIVVNIKGYVHLQVNPFNSYNADKIIANAKRESRQFYPLHEFIADR